MEKLTDLEFRALEILREDSRISVTELAKRLNISRSTATRLLRNLSRKGVKFTIKFQNEPLIAFTISESCQSDECYKLLDGRFINIIRANTLEDLENKLKNVKGKDLVFIGKSSFVVKCDYCGKEIYDNPLTYKIGRRTYYACCNSCLTGLKEKFARNNDLNLH
ncbi:putative transcriptional regulator, AsnC family [Sulfolobus islandicus Y.G.57.14]|uniref:Transcriptional regulators n=9 Tax=Saccharolobus islandicus TaxID=43080 RepID=M9UIB5_SACIS|nr:TRASH domain-containing protein [Sulfolobus islandicus]ACP39370.1 putative transcriptional regulator, AsnC family [Sulfolobus islandicus M.14.25]ACP47054.1 putative transcriptional regulator, AsnC family [Sulfolobus islandicus Y.G.57.14]ACP49910.1 putative transcriptional regulator, AsnC family [Sulfolobus islandicus Y.N.15.51]ACP56552.1 putative transcriptional regulator, AsnC family [Sulfolobus islandicus M.16.27]ACR43238.1 putative transcriptional regulator, AsnC family [Sulfolobus islan